MKPPARQSGSAEISIAIVEISGRDADIAVKVIDGAGAPMITMKVASAAVKADVLELALEMMGEQFVFTGKRVDDHLEGKATAPREDPVDWTGRPTTKDKLPSPAEMAAAQGVKAVPDQSAFTAAISKANLLDREALTKSSRTHELVQRCRDAATGVDQARR